MTSTLARTFPRSGEGRKLAEARKYTVPQRTIIQHGRRFNAAVRRFQAMQASKGLLFSSKATESGDSLLKWKTHMIHFLRNARNDKLTTLVHPVLVAVSLNFLTHCLGRQQCEDTTCGIESPTTNTAVLHPRSRHSSSYCGANIVAGNTPERHHLKGFWFLLVILNQA